MTQARPTFFMKRSDRLIARLRHMLYGLRFSKQVGGRLIFVWTPLPEWFQRFDSRHYHVNTIFDIREHYARGGADDLIFFDSVSPFPSDLLSLQGEFFKSQIPSKFDREFFVNKNVVVYSGVYIRFQFSDEEKTIPQLRNEVRELYEGLPLDPVVARILKTSKEKMGSESYAALHVRRGDVGEMLRRDLPKLMDGNLTKQQAATTIGHYISRTAPFSFYYRYLEACIGKGERILFTSDSPETLEHFTQKFGAKHFVDVNKFVRARYPLQKAFLDFNMLIGANKIISTGSTYAAFASELGGGQLHNVVNGNADAGTLTQFAIEQYAPRYLKSRKLRKLLFAEIEAQMRLKGRV